MSIEDAAQHIEKISSGESKKGCMYIEAIGLVVGMKKIVNKSGNPMVFLRLEGMQCSYEATIFARERETVAHKLQEYCVAIITGTFSVHLESGRKGIRVQTIKVATIEQVRAQATEMDLMDTTELSPSPKRIRV